MRSVIISAIIAVVMVAGSILYTNKLDNISAELIKINDNIGESLKKEDFESANADIEKMRDYLEKKRSMLDATGNHTEMDNIEMNIFELLEYSKEEQKADALSKNRVLGFLYKHLPVNYKLKWENIL